MGPFSGSFRRACSAIPALLIKISIVNSPETAFLGKFSFVKVTILVTDASASSRSAWTLRQRMEYFEERDSQSSLVRAVEEAEV